VAAKSANQRDIVLNSKGYRINDSSHDEEFEAVIMTTMSMGPKYMSNLIHTPLGPHFVHPVCNNIMGCEYNSLVNLRLSVDKRSFIIVS
jgi:hypothetical protein